MAGGVFENLPANAHETPVTDFQFNVSELLENTRANFFNVTLGPDVSLVVGEVSECLHAKSNETLGLDFKREVWDELMEVDRETCKHQTIQHEELFLKLSDHLPKELIFEREMLVSRL